MMFITTYLLWQMHKLDSYPHGQKVFCIEHLIWVDLSLDCMSFTIESEMDIQMNWQI